MKNNVVSIKRECYNLAVNNSAKSADISLYGQIVDRRPVNFWTGEELKGDYIIQSEFLEDLKSADGCSEINISLSSVGGLVHAGLVIHNKLREAANKGVKINCTVDGVAMSAGSVIMCAADNVRVHPSSLVMIHKASIGIHDMQNADELRKAAESLDAYDNAIVSAYKRKTGMDEKELLDLMSAETYMTGAEALEKGFANELLDEKGAEIAASADKASLIVNGHVLPLGRLKCPDNLPVAKINTVSSSSENAGELSHTQKNITEGGNIMANETQIPAAGAGAPAVDSAKANEEAINKAVLAERERLSKIDAIAAQFGADIVADAKYNNPCTAEEMAYRAALDSAKKGTAFLKKLEQDAENSGAASVSAAAAPDDKTESMMSDEELLAKAKAEIKALIGGDV